MKENSNSKIPAHNIEIEQALLGALMIKPEYFADIADIISADSFYVERHREIFNAISDLSSKAEPIDILSVSARLKDRNLLEKIGGASYLAELSSVVPSTNNLEHYAKVIQHKHLLRQLVGASHEIAQWGQDESQDVSEVIDKAEKRIYEIANKTYSKNVIDLRGAIDQAWERLDKLNKSDHEIRGVPTGFTDLDDKLSGLQKSDLIILAARPSMGKTALALDIARQSAVKHNTSTVIFSLEMSAQQLADRMLAAEARVDAWKIRTGKRFTDDEYDRIGEATQTLSNAPIVIDDAAGNTILKMRAVARRLKSKGKLDLIIVDYLQLMLPSGSAKNSDSMVQQVTEISRSLKQLAKELDVPVLALSQLSRAVEQRGGRPRLSDLRDSGSIEQDADVVIFIHREDKYKEESEKQNIAEILIEKHRNGPVGKIELYFHSEKATFANLDKKRKEEKEFDGF